MRKPARVAEVKRLLNELDGEAIVLAQELHANWLLMDEKVGRRVARREAVPVLGLGGILLLAKGRGLIPSIGSHLDRLESEAGFYLGEDVKKELLGHTGESAS